MIIAIFLKYKYIIGFQTLHICKMQIHVIVQDCPKPKYLVSHCEEKIKLCHFSCSDERLELHGKSSLYCGEDMKWEGNLPVCRGNKIYHYLSYYIVKNRDHELH